MDWLFRSVHVSHLVLSIKDEPIHMYVDVYFWVNCFGHTTNFWISHSFAHHWRNFGAIEYLVLFFYLHNETGQNWGNHFPWIVSSFVISSRDIRISVMRAVYWLNSQYVHVLKLLLSLDWFIWMSCEKKKTKISQWLGANASTFQQSHQFSNNTDFDQIYSFFERKKLLGSV